MTYSELMSAMKKTEDLTFKRHNSGKILIEYSILQIKWILHVAEILLQNNYSHHIAK
jgi:hypothetical protein